MIAWLAVAAALVAAVLVGVLRWRAGWPQHEEWIRQILADDREVADLAQQLRRVAREHEQNS